MVKVSTDIKLTLEEFLALPEGDVNYEFVDGQAIPKVSPKYFHSTLQAAFIILLRTWCKGKGRVGSEWAILLKRQGKDWAPVPDLTYISYERLPKSWKRNEACPECPELVIEIISPDQTMKEFEDKAKDYLEAGVSRAWVVDPESISIRVFLSDESIQVYTDNKPIVDALLPELKLTTRQIFEEAELL
ncbi:MULTISPECIES: Uma2 family endonuclease [unclassified Coleofasciculus]|uniref:Uma2 family endonuclease n=1 Tax=unclassified Coleofasciculus TaxID=2692782 RepID=UPI0018812937|nr:MULTISPECIES: Uma2 family endonuclease [unclassified Coleofasciculus]MBE9126814.1 Uma2 family endonuclease [Coleofasciculus sp. LEGE 07081]MBE9150185.1 Uma2 family endonuclease [Coleofasciculus sp. LEGE 07092]